MRLCQLLFANSVVNPFRYVLIELKLQSSVPKNVNVSGKKTIAKNIFALIVAQRSALVLFGAELVQTLLVVPKNPFLAFFAKHLLRFQLVRQSIVLRDSVLLTVSIPGKESMAKSIFVLTVAHNFQKAALKGVGLAPVMLGEQGHAIAFLVENHLVNAGAEAVAGCV